MPRRNEGQVVWEAVLDDGKARRTAGLLQGAFASLGTFPGLRGASTQLTAIGGALSRIGPLATAVAGAFGLIALSINRAVREFAAFETQLARIATTTGGTLGQISTQYGTLIQEISRETGIATDAIAAGIQKAISGGVTEFEQIRRLVGQATRFQAAGLGELNVAVSAATTLFANLGIESAESLNAIARAAQLGEGEVSDFSGAAKRLSSQARILGIDLETMLATLANISQTAPSVSEGMINIEGVYRALIKPSEQAKEAFESIGLSVESLRRRIAQGDLTGVIRDIQQEITAAGTEGAALAGQFFRNTQGLIGLISLNADVIDEFTAEIRDANGTIDRAFDEMAMTMQFSFNRLGTIWTTSWQNLGELAVRASGLDLFLRRVTQEFDTTLTGIANKALAFANTYESIITNLFGIFTPEYLTNITRGIRETALDILDEQALQQEVDAELRRIADVIAAGGTLPEGTGRFAAQRQRELLSQLNQARQGTIALTSNQINRLIIEEGFYRRLADLARQQEAAVQGVGDAQDGGTQTTQRQIVNNERLLRIYREQNQAATAAARQFQQVQSLQNQLAIVEAQPTAQVGTDQFFAQRRVQLEAERNAAFQQAADTLGVYSDAFLVQLMIIDAEHRNALIQLGNQSAQAAQQAAEIFNFTLNDAISNIVDALAMAEDNTEGWIRALGRVALEFLRIRQAQGAQAGGTGGFFSALLGAIAGGGGIPGFQQGGRVPGPLGSPQLIVAHGGETVNPIGATGDVFVFQGLNLDRNIRRQIFSAAPEFANMVRAQAGLGRER